MLTFASSTYLPLVSAPASRSPSNVGPLRKPRRSAVPYLPSRAPCSPPVCLQQQMPSTPASKPSHDDNPSATVTASSAPQSSPPQQQQKPPPTLTPDTISPHWLLSYLKANKDRVDAALEACLHSDESTSTIVSSMRYSLLAGGKRVRPNLAIAAYEMFAGPAVGTEAEKARHLAAVMPAALSVEMIHTMSLIHDDLPSMDNDDFRRGKPTNHKVYGEDIAILAGDALLAYAFEFVAKHTPTTGDNAQRVVDVLGLLAESVGPNGLAGGQVMDLENEGRSNVSLDTLTWIHTHKTAVLLRVSCACGAILGGANKEDVKRVSDFAVKTGLAFQIADDLLDVTQSTEVLGKTAGKDQAANKATYPRLLGLDGSRNQAELLITEAKHALEPYGDRANTLIALADFIINRQN